MAKARDHYRGVLLDIDGTLVDSNDAHAAAWAEVLSEAGFDVSFDAVRPLIGMGGDQLLPRVTDLDPESPEGKRVAAERGRRFLKTYLPQVRPLPGARDLVLRLLDEGYRAVIATSARENEMHALLEVAGIGDLDLPTTSADDAAESKPEPDIIHAALRKVGCHPSEALLLGDTPYDLEACRKAGVAAVAVRSGGFSDEALMHAVAVYDDPADVLRHLEQSPFARHA